MTAKSITRAKAAYQTGDWTEAERLCRIILAEKSDDLDALNLLGIIAAQTQRASEAEALLSRAIQYTEIGERRVLCGNHYFCASN
jgi:Flp pilus assembly protein TadD